MNEFISSQRGLMSPLSKKRILGEDAPAPAEDTGGDEDTVGDLPPSKPLPGRSLQRLESWNVKKGQEAKSEFLSETELEAQASIQAKMDPTLSFVLSEEGEREKADHMETFRSSKAGGGLGRRRRAKPSRDGFGRWRRPNDGWRERLTSSWRCSPRGWPQRARRCEGSRAEQR